MTQVEVAAKEQMESTKVPTHLGIILDGNRRWAREKGLPDFEGHRAGYQTLKKIAIAAQARGVKYLTAYVFSTENWQRSEEEVSFLMNLFLWAATKEIDEINRENIRLRFLGSSQRLTPKIIKAMAKAEAKTVENTGSTLGLCLNYGGQIELAEATARIVADGVKPEDVTPELISKYLYAPDIPPVDLIIRTSGEQRISNFMLWRAAYSELLFVQKHWPAFTEADLDSALAEFASRSRRFGGN